MKKSACFLLFLFFAASCFGQGASCSAPYTIPLDAQTRSYTISSLTGTAMHCTNSIYSGTGHVTIFSFTTNASASCVLIDLTCSGGQPAEAVLFPKCSGGGALQNPEWPSSVCFDDGTGLWAPSETLALQPNKQYFLRIWTPGTGSLSMSAKSYDPPNNTCAGATPIGSTPISDNNACHKPAVGIEPSDLCAFSLENTAFYSYIVDITGISILNITDIACDNSAAGAVAGFQIGFFRGSCSGLIPINCYAATGGFVTAPTNSMESGTQVIVAIDGMSGSNCTYKISAFNGVFLPVVMKYFTAWAGQESNTLRWLTAGETDRAQFTIEKSMDGIHFLEIGSLPNKMIASGEDYSFSDRDPWPDQYYRLKITGANGKVHYSSIVRLKNNSRPSSRLVVLYPVLDQLHFKISSEETGLFKIKITDATGRLVKTEEAKLNKGENIYSISLDKTSKGVYYLSVEGYSSKGYSFIKQ